MAALVEDQIHRHFQMLEDARATADDRKARSLPKPWKRPHPQALCQESEFLEAVTEYSYDLSDKGFSAYCARRGLLHVAGQPGSRRWQFYAEPARREEEYRADPYFQFANEHQGVRHRYSAGDMDIGWKIIRYGRARLQDCWELYQAGMALDTAAAPAE